MLNRRNLGVAVLATMLCTTSFAGANAALGRANDDPWLVAPGSLGTGANMAKDWIQPQPMESP